MPEVIFNGPEGRIEGRYTHSEDTSKPAVLVLHPHPLHGGTMNNKVVYELFHACARKGCSVLRINFRGVGRSTGTFDSGIGELADAARALDWLQQENPSASTYWIAGFSFGSWIAMQLLMRRPELSGFIGISPPVNKYDFSFLSPCPASGLILQGDQDSVVPEDAVTRFTEKVAKQKGVDIDYHIIPGADHFFRATMKDMVDYVEQYIEQRLGDLEDPAPIKRDRRRRQSTVE